MRVPKENVLRALGVKYECFEHYSKGAPHCADCGCYDLRELVLDHVNGGGCEERRKVSLGIGGYHYYFYLRKLGYPDNPVLEVRCGDCHRKRHKLEGAVKLSRHAVPSSDSISPIPEVKRQSLWEEQTS